jgi:hypothetical protein
MRFYGIPEMSCQENSKKASYSIIISVSFKLPTTNP